MCMLVYQVQSYKFIVKVTGYVKISLFSEL